MPEFLAETYTPRDGLGAAVPGAGDLARAAARASGPGAPVCFQGAIAVPAEETCFWLYQADTAEAVRAAMAAAGLRPERITPAVTIRPPRPAETHTPGSLLVSGPKDRPGPKLLISPIGANREGSTTMPSTTPTPKSRRRARLLSALARPPAAHPPQDGRRTAMRALMRRAAVAAGAAVVLLGPAVAAVATGTAAQAASADCTTTGTTVTCSYTWTGGNQSFTVPAGVTSLDVTAIGAFGGDASGCSSQSFGGPGASVEDTAVPVTADQGQALTVIVGGTGGPGTVTNGGAGGSPGGGGPGGDYPNGNVNANCDGGGGGGFSGLLDSAGAALVIGAGGGGGGGSLGPDASGGPGDTTGHGIAGVGCTLVIANCADAGQGGTSTMGGAGGAGYPGGGTGGTGGSLTGGPGGASNASSNTPQSSGGGGGGGYYGGGGGGGGGTGGGGGGGSSFGISGLTNETIGICTSQLCIPPSVTISYQVPAAATTTTVSAPATGTAGGSIPGSSISATLSGATSGAGGTITFTGFSGSAPPTDCSSGGTRVGSSPVAVSGNGTYHPTNAAVALTSAGTIWWYASYSGDAANAPSNSGCGPGMAATVISKAATTTTVSAPATGTTGTAIPASSISATLGGPLQGLSKGTITFTVFGPQSSPPLDCSSGGTQVGNSPAAVSGNGTYNPSDGFTPPSGGTYWWYASYTGDAGNLASDSGCGPGMTATVVSVPQSTTTTAAGNATATFSASSQKVTLSASVTPASQVNEGTVTFTVANNSNQTVGQAAAAPVSGGSAQVSYGLPAGLPAGTYTIDAKYSDPGGSFADSSDTTATLTVTKATPQITWAGPAGITWGTPLSATQLDATAPVPGTFTYTPPSGTVLGPGNNQALSVSFTPADTADYTGATATAKINVVFSPAACLTTTVAGPLVIGTGQAYCVGAGATITNGVTVKPGGALYLTGGTIKGPVSATGPAALTLCGATVKGNITITGTTGPLALGTCGTNTITGNVSLTGNTGGLTYQNNTVTGSLTITGNTGGFHYLTGNKTTGKVTINNNT